MKSEKEMLFQTDDKIWKIFFFRKNRTGYIAGFPDGGFRSIDFYIFMNGVVAFDNPIEEVPEIVIQKLRKFGETL